MPEDPSKKLQEVVGVSQDSPLKTLYSYTLTPYPAWALSASLFLTPLISAPKAILKPLLSRGSAVGQVVKVGPTNVSSLVFGLALAAGGYMTYDGDYANGAGFSMVWSALYLLANGGKGVKALRYGRVWPGILALQALGCGALYGRRFIWD